MKKLTKAEILENSKRENRLNFLKCIIEAYNPHFSIMNLYDINSQNIINTTNALILLKNSSFQSKTTVLTSRALKDGKKQVYNDIKINCAESNKRSKVRIFIDVDSYSLLEEDDAKIVFNYATQDIINAFEFLRSNYKDENGIVYFNDYMPKVYFGDSLAREINKAIDENIDNINPLIRLVCNLTKNENDMDNFINIAKEKDELNDLLSRKEEVKTSKARSL